MAGENLLINPGFDTDLGSWNCSSTVGVAIWDPLDVDASPTSGSVRVDHNAPSDNSLLICSQCVVAEAGQDYRLSVFTYFADDVGFTLDGSSRIQIMYSDDSGCSHAIGVGDLELIHAHVGNADQWLPITTQWSTAPGGTVAAAALFFVWADHTGNQLRFHYDAALLEPFEPEIFIDGFESGDTTVSSATVP